MALKPSASKTCRLAGTSDVDGPFEFKAAQELIALRMLGEPGVGVDVIEKLYPGWWWLERDFDFSIQLETSSSHLTHTFSEGWVYYQPVSSSRHFVHGEVAVTAVL